MTARCIREDDQPCHEPCAYLVRIADCPGIVCAGLLWCAGHPACIAHAANLRSGAYESMGPDVWVRHQPLDVALVTNGARAW